MKKGIGPNESEEMRLTRQIADSGKVKAPHSVANRLIDQGGLAGLVSQQSGGDDISRIDISSIPELLEKNRKLEQEIAEFRFREQQSSQLNSLYKAVVETSKDIISTMTLDLKYTYVSPSVINALGYTPEEMLKLNALEIMTPESRQRIITSLGDWLKKGAAGIDPSENSRTEEAQQYMKNGAIRWAEITGTFLRDDDGRPIGIMTTSRDITQRKRLEKQLRESFQFLEKRVQERTAELESMNEILMLEIHQRKKTERCLLQSEKRCEAIFSAAQDCIFMKDRELRYTHVNPALVEITGMAAEEIIGNRFDDIFGEGGGVGIRKADLKALNGQTVESDYTLEIDNRAIVLNCIRVPIRDETGAVTGVCGIARNITEKTERTTKNLPLPSRSSSAAYEATLRDIELVAGADSTVLFLGESGSGKDYLAKYLHERSRRAGSPFFAVNCAALPHTLAESELFGHEAGSFTGSRSKKRGLLELAESGTLLLNEIGDLVPNVQAKLLTFLDTQSFTRVGGERLVNIDARILAATNKNLAAEVEKGNFRSDLFFRLNVFTIVVPPLRERIDDLPKLCDELLAGLSRKLGAGSPPGIDSSAMRILKQYDWPGNIRELRNVLERALILSQMGNIQEHHLGNTLKLPRVCHNALKREERQASSYSSMRGMVKDVQETLITDALISNHGNVTKTAASLGMTRDALKHLMKKLGIRRHQIIDQ